MTDDAKPKTESKAWKEMRDSANEATLASSEALKDDALTDPETPIEDIKTKPS